MAENNMPDISGLVSSLISDERFAELLSGLKGTKRQEETEPTAEPTISPELMAKLPQIIAAVSGTKQAEEKPSHADERRALLYALRPFMSDKRKAAIDTVIELGGLAGLMHKH